LAARFLLEGSSTHQVVAVVLLFFAIFSLLLENNFDHYHRKLLYENLQKDECIGKISLERDNLLELGFHAERGDRIAPEILSNSFPPQAWSDANPSNQNETEQFGQVLVVDDNLINQQVARELLESVGLGVSLACNGQEALNKIFQEKYDLLLMDVQMPEMDGYEATRQIRQFSQFKDLPIVAMTAYAMPEDKERCLASGMNDHISKPFEPETLYQAIAKWLNFSRPLGRAAVV